MSNKIRITAIDGLRGVAVSLVLFWHYIVNQIGENNDIISKNIYKYGSATWSGVDLFFIISGFLITSILLKYRNNKNIILIFYVKRILRIFPLYFLLAFIFLIVVFSNNANISDYLFKEKLPLISYFVFIQNFYSAKISDLGPNWLSVAWSLAVEEQFYLFIPWVVVYLKRSHAIFTICILIVAAPIWRFQIGGVAAYVLPFCRADSILMGSLCAFLVTSSYWEFLRVKFFNKLMITTCFILLGLISFVINLSQIGGVLNHIYFSLLFSFVILIAYENSFMPIRGLLNLNWLAWLGIRCFPIYLFHLPVNSIFQESLLEKPYNIYDSYSFTVVLISLSATLLVANFSHNYFESYFLKMGEKYKYSDAQGSSQR